MKHAPTPIADNDRAAQLAQSHLATLDLIPTVTDFPCTIARADTLRRRVRWFASNGNAGMLGRNGMGPEIDMLAKSAASHGFEWRGRVVAAIPQKKER